MKREKTSTIKAGVRSGRRETGIRMWTSARAERQHFPCIVGHMELWIRQDAYNPIVQREGVH